MAKQCKECHNVMPQDCTDFCPECSTTIIQLFQERLIMLPLAEQKQELSENEILAAYATLTFESGKYGYDRTAACGCSWSSKVHGSVCPEHGEFALHK